MAGVATVVSVFSESSLLYVWLYFIFLFFLKKG